MTGDPSSMVGPAREKPGTIGDCRAALARGRLKSPPPVKDIELTGAGYASTACAHPTTRTIDGIESCPRCGTILTPPEPEDDDSHP